MSPPDSNDSRLPDRAEALLAGWPAPARSALDWEDTASSIMARVRGTAVGSTPDELLMEPLPLEEADSALRPTLADEPGLAEIARAALGGPAAFDRDVARDGFLAAEQGRRRALAAARPAADIASSASAASLQGRVARHAPRPEPALVSSQPKTVAAVDEATPHSQLPAPKSRESRPELGPSIYL